MLLICDQCRQVTLQIFKIPTSGFFIRDESLIVLKEYASICADCLFEVGKRN